MIDSPEIFRLIQNATLFRGVQSEFLKSLFRKASLVTLKPGEKLLSPGKINEQVYIVISGRLNVQVTASPSDDPIAMLTPGECVGEMSVLVDGLVSAYVIAVTKCELFAIDYSSFWSLIDGSNEAARNMLNILVQRIRLGNEVVADSLQHHDGYPEHVIFDNLTGLYNRHGIHEKFDRLLRRCVADKQPVCLIVLEPDEFERPDNSEEKLGREQSLRTIAQTILTFLRPDDHAAHLIGKKFAILLAATALPAGSAIAERLRAAVSQAPIVLPNGNTLQPFTISAGVCEALPDDTWNSLNTRTDMALEQAIAAGRNRVVSA